MPTGVYVCSGDLNPPAHFVWQMVIGCASPWHLSVFLTLRTVKSMLWSVGCSCNQDVKLAPITSHVSLLCFL